MMKAQWTGHLRFALLNLNIKIYTAVSTDNKISLNLVNSETGNGIAMIRTDKVTGKIVKNEDVVKGYSTGDDTFIQITNEDIETVKKLNDKVLDIEGFIPMSEVTAEMCEKPYYIAPADKINVNAYNLMVEGIKKSGMVGIAKAIIRDKDIAFAIFVKNEVLMAVQIRYGEHIRHTDDVPNTGKGEKIDPAQLKMMATLIKGNTQKSIKSFKLKDTYNDGLTKLIAAKLEGKEFKINENAKSVAKVDIMDALKASIDEQKKTR